MNAPSIYDSRIATLILAALNGALWGLVVSILVGSGLALLTGLELRPLLGPSMLAGLGAGARGPLRGDARDRPRGAPVRAEQPHGGGGGELRGSGGAFARGRAVQAPVSDGHELTQHTIAHATHTASGATTLMKSMQKLYKTIHVLGAGSVFLYG